MPYGHGQRFGSNSNFLLQEVLGGWRLSGSSVKYTSFPVTLSTTTNYSNKVFAYGGGARPDQIKQPAITNRSILHWFGTDPSVTQPCAADTNNGVCAYAAQSLNHFGTARTGSLRAPGFLDVDAALQKSFTIFKEHRVDFRSDFFNAFNIASYGNPENNITAANFGLINSTRSTERHIEFELKYAF